MKLLLGILKMEFKKGLKKSAFSRAYFYGSNNAFFK